MSLFEEAVAAAVKLPQEQREHLAQALGLKLAPAGNVSTFNRNLPLAVNMSRPDPVAWRKAESGHAVLAVDENLRDEEIPAGAKAIAGIWQHRAEELTGQSTPAPARVADLPSGTPVVLHYDWCLALATGDADALQFFENPGIEFRLATAGYLALLGAAENVSQQKRVRRFVQPFAVLSLGPMASSRAVELMVESSLKTGLSPLDALMAATALAHEIPLVARDAAKFSGVSGLTVCGI